MVKSRSVVELVSDYQFENISDIVAPVLKPWTEYQFEKIMIVEGRQVTRLFTIKKPHPEMLTSVLTRDGQTIIKVEYY